jgi:hypothetical protein
MIKLLLLLLCFCGPVVADSITTIQLNTPANPIYTWGPNLEDICAGAFANCNATKPGSDGWSWVDYGYTSAKQSGGWVYVTTPAFVMLGVFNSSTYDAATGIPTANFTDLNTGWQHLTVTGTFTEDLLTGYGSMTVSSEPATVPEPATWVLMGIGGGLMLLRRFGGHNAIN